MYLEEEQLVSLKNHNVPDVHYQSSNKSFITWKHIDGPLLVLENGKLHWLTYFERFMFYLGFFNIDNLVNRNK